MIDELNKKGFTIVRNVVSEEWIFFLKKGAEKAFQEHREIQNNNNNDIDVDGVALHAILSDDVFIEFLIHLSKSELFKDIEDEFFKSKFIMNSFSALNNKPNKTNFSGEVHRDTKFYSGKANLMLNVLVMLDDFTEDNGPTLVLPYSHLFSDKPSDEFFENNCKQVIGKKGDVLLFHGDVWHCSSLNNTQNDRIALPITLTKSSIKQLLDYPRAIGYDRMDSFSVDIQQLLGYHSRVASNLDEWYQPFENRFYKKDQD